MAMSDYEFLDERFGKCVNTNARVEKLYTGCRWAEGPAVFPGRPRICVWSDIPNDRISAMTKPTSRSSVFRHPAGYTNGHTVDRQGR